MTFFANAQHFFKIASNGEVAVNDTEIVITHLYLKLNVTNNTETIFDHRNTSNSEELFRFRDTDAQNVRSININTISKYGCL